MKKLHKKPFQRKNQKLRAKLGRQKRLERERAEFLFFKSLAKFTGGLEQAAAGNQIPVAVVSDPPILPGEQLK